MNDQRGAPHPPAPPEQRRLLPERQMLARGIGLAALAAGLAGAAFRVARAAGVLSAPAVATLGIGSLLAAWAALIHVTGGERFDDHPWV
jgi:hypothetical protein